MISALNEKFINRPWFCFTFYYKTCALNMRTFIFRILLIHNPFGLSTIWFRICPVVESWWHGRLTLIQFWKTLLWKMLQWLPRLTDCIRLNDSQSCLICRGPLEFYQRAMFYFLKLRRKCCLHSYISLYTNGDMFLVCIWSSN